MRPIRSLLWIGSGRGLSESGVTEAPELDVTWVPALDDALSLPRVHFDGLLLECGRPSSLGPAIATLSRWAGPTPILILLATHPAPRPAAAPASTAGAIDAGAINATDATDATDVADVADGFDVADAMAAVGAAGALECLDADDAVEKAIAAGAAAALWIDGRRRGTGAGAGLVSRVNEILDEIHERERAMRRAGRDAKAGRSRIGGACSATIAASTPATASEARAPHDGPITTTLPTRRTALAAPAPTTPNTQPAPPGPNARSSAPAAPASPVPPVPPARLVTASPSMREILDLVDRAATSPSTVLLTGETGAGKEVIARELHARSDRAAAPFVAINCAAFPETLLESELFGHVKGAFTGADRARTGLFEAAGAGTLFLDEIAEMGLPLQAKLLRVLQEREIRPVGGTRVVAITCRIVAATNRVLAEEVHAGHFREDLFYRLNVFPIRIPPLRERREDILPLARHFIARHGPREGKPDCHLSLAAGQLLQSYAWPGNVRELENEILRALMMTTAGELITPKTLSPKLVEILEPIAQGARSDETLRDALERVEAWMIRRALGNNAGRKARTARKLGLTREGLYKKMKRLGIE